MEAFQHGPRLVAVYGSDDDVRHAVRAALDAGVPQHAVRLAHHDDDVAALRGEMHEEVDNALLVPAGGPATKGMVKGSILITIGAAVLGALLLSPLALFDWAGLSQGMVLVVVLITGALMGATAGFLIGGPTGARGPAEPPATRRGITLGIATDDERVVDVLPREGLIRLDRIGGDGRPLGVIETEEAQVEGGVVEDLTDRLQQTEGDWSDVRGDPEIDLRDPDRRTHPDRPGANRPGRTG